MKTVALADHELSVSDYSKFELNLILRAGRITATVKAFSTNGLKCLRLTNPVIVFDETQTSEARIETLFKASGFQRLGAASSQKCKLPTLDLKGGT